MIGGGPVYVSGYQYNLKETEIEAGL